MSKKKEEVPEGVEPHKPQETHKNLDDLNYNEVQEVCKELNISPKGKLDYLKKLIRAEWVNLKVNELPPQVKKEFKNLDDMSEDQVHNLAMELNISITGKKPERVKREIRITMANKEMVEMPAVGLVVSKKKADITRNENFTFNHKFTDSEMISKSQQLANANCIKQGILDEKKSVMSNFADRLNQRDAEINILSREVSSGQEMVTKTCSCVYDFSVGVKIYVYDKKEVGRVPMQQSDYQLDVEFPDKDK